jgi:hypothetical protein
MAGLTIDFFWGSVNIFMWSTSRAFTNTPALLRFIDDCEEGAGY